MALSILILLFLELTSADTEPEAVNEFTFFLKAPYSTGNLNCFSLTKLFDELTTATFLNLFLPTKEEAIISPSIKEAQAL